MERSHYQAMASLAPVAQHQTLIDAFPDVSLRQLFLVAGCTGISEKGGTAPSELYTGQCTTMQVVRELGVKIIYALLQHVVQEKQGDIASLITVSDVNKGRIAMGMPTDNALYDEAMMLSCPSVKELVKKSKEPPRHADEEEREDQILIHANKARELWQKRLLRSTVGLLRNIQISQGGTGEREGAIQKRLAALYESQEWRNLDACLFLPRTIFEKLIPPVFYSIAGHVPRLSPGAKSLIQYTCEEALLIVIRRAWQALRHYGHRKVIACEDVCVMARILEPVMSALQARIPSELKSALDAEEGRRREPSAKSISTPGRSRSRDSRRTPSPEPPKRRRGSAR